MTDRKRYIAYKRVSTKSQAEDGFGLISQDDKIGQWAAFVDGEIVASLSETMSGKSMSNRPVLAQALDMLRRGEADGLVVLKLDRLARSVQDFAALLSEFLENGWSLVILDLQVDLGTPVGRLVASILAAVAEFERNLISERTKAGLAAAAASGVRLGRPPKVRPEPSALLLDTVTAALGADQ